MTQRATILAATVAPDVPAAAVTHLRLPAERRDAWVEPRLDPGERWRVERPRALGDSGHGLLGDVDTPSGIFDGA